MEIKKGDIYYANLSPVVGSEQGGIRPVVIIQNNVGNEYSTITIAAVTSKLTKNRLPTHAFVRASEDGFSCDSVILLEQIRTIDKIRLIERIGTLSQDALDMLDEKLRISFAL